MTPTQQLGYKDQKAGTLDPDLSRADTPAGREYRDGMRQCRADLVAQSEMTDFPPLLHMGFVPAWATRLSECSRMLLAENPAKTAYEVAHENGGHGASEGAPILDAKLAEMRAKNQPNRPVEAADEPQYPPDSDPGPSIIPPVYEKKKARKAKPTDEGQGRFL